MNDTLTLTDGELTAVAPDGGEPRPHRVDVGSYAVGDDALTLVGTTDVDHKDGSGKEPTITRAELDYLMAALQAQFPQLGLHASDIIATYAGVRPVVDSGADGTPSTAGREHAISSSKGLVSVTGGKLTTFRAIALDTLREQASTHGWSGRSSTSCGPAGPGRRSVPPTRPAR